MLAKCPILLPSDIQYLLDEFDARSVMLCSDLDVLSYHNKCASVSRWFKNDFKIAYTFFSELMERQLNRSTYSSLGIVNNLTERQVSRPRL